MSDLNDLMNRDPLKLTDADITEVVEFFRKQRHLFKNNIGGARPKAKPKLTAKQEAVAKLDLGDLKL